MDAASKLSVHQLKRDKKNNQSIFVKYMSIQCLKVVWKLKFQRHQMMPLKANKRFYDKLLVMALLAHENFFKSPHILCLFRNQVYQLICTFLILSSAQQTANKDL